MPTVSYPSKFVTDLSPRQFVALSAAKFDSGLNLFSIPQFQQLSLDFSFCKLYPQWEASPDGD